jgi:isoamylase
MNQPLIRNAGQLEPLEEVAGFKVRPGYYSQNGALALPNAVSFTIHSYNATSVELVLFKRTETEPYAIIPFPQSYRIGKVFSMMVFDLDIEEFEYAYRLDGPNDP